MKKLKEIMIILLMIVLVIVGGNNIVNAAGAMDSKPGVELGPADPPPYAPGQQIQQDKEEEEKKEEEEQKKEEAEEKKKLSDEEKKKFTADEIVDYVQGNYKNHSGGISDGSIDTIEESQEVIDQWRLTLKNAGYDKNGTAEQKQTAGAVETQSSSGRGGSSIYHYPSKVDPEVGDSEQSLEDMIQDADDFINKGAVNIDQTTLSNFSKTMYNILLTVGVVVAVIIGALIGLKLMTSSIEEKAEAKKLLVPYVVGCVVVFGGFAIWKIVVTILQNI